MSNLESFQRFIKKKSRYVDLPLLDENVEYQISKIYKYNGNFIDIIFYKITEGRPITTLMVDGVVLTIKTVIDFFKTNGRTISIHISPSNEKKLFPTSNIITETNVNNAVTVTYSVSGGMNEKFIFIYRYEDMYKVLVHELIHFLDYDLCHTIPNNHPILKPYNIHDTSGKVNLGEAYTETLACYIYIVYVLGKNSNTEKENLMARYKIRFLRIAKALTDHCSKYDNVIQTSHMFSYYICRALLFLDIEKFVEFFKAKNTKGLLLLIKTNQLKIYETDGLPVMHI
jgi:hypothetical protein